MTPTAPALLRHETPPPIADTNTALMRQLLALALPVLAENVLHMMVGLNDTYLANHLPREAASAGAAVGTITYFLWFMGLIVGSVGTGATALISRARGSRHRSLANSVCGQSMAMALILGVVMGAAMYLAAGPVIGCTGLGGTAPPLALSYLRMLSVTLPFMFAMLIASACLRGDGDTLSPAIIMIIVDAINMLCSFALCRGWWGLPVMGFNGIALGTIIAYVAGGVLQFLLLLRGRPTMRLHLHRLWPHWNTLKRLFRIGIPAGTEGLVNWLANFGVIRVINGIDPTNVMPNAHMNTIRLESVSFMTGMAFGTAAATMVGISLGMKSPARAIRSTWLAYAIGGGAMTLFGILFITVGHYPAAWLSPDNPQIAELTTRCLRITGCIQSGFAAYIIFSGALRGAGDTFVVMVISLATVIVLRFAGVLVVGAWLHQGLAAIWVVLATELFLRGLLALGRFQQGGWRRIRV
jgi:putative MATE family efflux protein